MVWRHRFEIEADGRPAFGRRPAVDAGDLIQERPVLHLGHAVAFAAGETVGGVAGIGLRDEDPVVAVHGDAVEQRADTLHHRLELVRRGVEHEQVPVGYGVVVGDVGLVVERQDVVVGENVLDGVEGTAVSTDLALETPRELGLVAGLESDHVEPLAAHRDRAGVLGADRETLAHVARRDVDHRDLVGGTEGHVGLVVAGKGDAHRFVEIGG